MLLRFKKEIIEAARRADNYIINLTANETVTEQGQAELPVADRARAARGERGEDKTRTVSSWWRAARTGQGQEGCVEKAKILLPGKQGNK